MTRDWKVGDKFRFDKNSIILILDANMSNFGFHYHSIDIEGIVNFITKSDLITQCEYVSDEEYFQMKMES